jgi:hypothetical protein
VVALLRRPRALDLRCGGALAPRWRSGYRCGHYRSAPYVMSPANQEVLCVVLASKRDVLQRG